MLMILSSTQLPLIKFRFKTNEDLIQSVTFVIKSNLDRLRYDKNVTQQLTATFEGYLNFIKQYMLINN